MTSVLVVNDHVYANKIENHIKPLASAVETNKYVGLNTDKSIDEIDYLQVPTFGYRYLGLLLLFPYALLEGFRNDYDIVVSVSLIPYGMYALLIGRLLGIPSHLVIIGGDIDKHAAASYGWVPKWLFRRFDTLSVLGKNHKQDLVNFGVPERSVYILTNAINIDQFHPGSQEQSYDLIWIGRFAPEKNPMKFIEILECLSTEYDVDVSSVMVGDGELREKVEAEISNRSIEDSVTLTGWVDEPGEYYRSSRLYVMTSEREAMGLTLVEAMASGIPAVVPKVGNIEDVVLDGQNGILLESPSIKNYCQSIESVLTDEGLWCKLSQEAETVGKSYSHDAAEKDWELIVRGTID